LWDSGTGLYPKVVHGYLTGLLEKGSSLEPFPFGEGVPLGLKALFWEVFHYTS